MLNTEASLFQSPTEEKMLLIIKKTSVLSMRRKDINKNRAEQAKRAAEDREGGEREG